MAPKIKFRNYVSEDSEGPPSRTSSEIPPATSLPLPPPSFFKTDTPLPPPQPPQQPIPGYIQPQHQPSSGSNSYPGPQPLKQPMPMMAGMHGLPTSFSGHMPMNYSSTPFGAGQQNGKGRGGKGKGGRANGNRQNDYGHYRGDSGGSVKRPYEASFSGVGDSNAGYSNSRGGRGGKGKGKGGGKGGGGNTSTMDGFWSDSFVEDPWAVLLAHAQRAT